MNHAAFKGPIKQGHSSLQLLIGTMDGTQSAEMDEHIKELRKVRKGKLATCKRKMNEIKRTMQEKDIDAVKQHFVIFQSLCEEFKNAHDAVQNVLAEEEKEKDKAEWYEPRMEPFQDFLVEEQDWEELMAQQGELEEQELPEEEQESVEPVAASEQQEAALYINFISDTGPYHIKQYK